MNGMLRRARATAYRQEDVFFLFDVASSFVALKNAILAARVATHDESVNFL